MFVFNPSLDFIKIFLAVGVALGGNVVQDGLDTFEYFHQRREEIKLPVVLQSVLAPHSPALRGQNKVRPDPSLDDGAVFPALTEEKII